jgi:hypothetical protein
MGKKKTTDASIEMTPKEFSDKTFKTVIINQSL